MAANRKRTVVTVGTRYGRLVCIESAVKVQCNVWHGRYVCDCGTSLVIANLSVVKGRTKSCGCLLSDVLVKRNRTHDMAKTPEYNTWFHMRARCENPKNRAYKNYGGRGITVCEEWRVSFEQFYADMGPKPPNTSIDRIDNNGNYEPSNCRWATNMEQAHNQRSNILITYDEITAPVSVWARMRGISANTLYARVHKGWPPGEALEFVPHIDGRTLANKRRTCNVD